MYYQISINTINLLFIFGILTLGNFWVRVAHVPLSATWTVRTPSERIFRPVLSCSSVSAVTGERWMTVRSWSQTMRYRRFGASVKTTTTKFRYQRHWRRRRFRPAFGTYGNGSWAVARVRGSLLPFRFRCRLGWPSPALPRRTEIDLPTLRRDGQPARRRQWPSCCPSDRPRWPRTRDPTVRVCPTTGPGCFRPVPPRCPPAASTARSCTPWCPRPGWRWGQPIRRRRRPDHRERSDPRRRYRQRCARRTCRLCAAGRTLQVDHRASAGQSCRWCRRPAEIDRFFMIISIDIRYVCIKKP